MEYVYTVWDLHYLNRIAINFRESQFKGMLQGGFLLITATV